MQWLQSQLIERFIEIGNTCTMQRIVQPVPGIFTTRPQLPPIQEHMVLVRVQVDGKPLLMKVGGAPQVCEPIADIAERENHLVIGWKIETILQCSLPQFTVRLVDEPGRVMDG